MKTKHFIKQHTFIKINKNKHLMYGTDNDYVFFDGDAMLNKAVGLDDGTPEDWSKIQNLIINYLDDLYLSEFEEIKSMM